MTQLRYAVVGAGSASRSHVRDIANLPGVALVGIADPAERSSWRLMADEATPHYRDTEALLRETRPDLVSVCTPNKFHHAATILALRAGAHVVCEKPMAMTVREAEEMEDARRSAGRLGAVNFPYRHVGAFRFAREVVSSGDLGALTRVNAVYLQSFRALHSTAGTWRGDITLAGFGALGDLGAHLLDMVRYVTGTELRRVVGIARPPRAEDAGRRGAARVTTDTAAAFLAELNGGVVATFEATQAAPGYGDLFRLELSGEGGTLIADSERPDVIQLRTGAAFARHATWKTDIPVHRVPTDFLDDGAPTSPSAIVHAIRGKRVEYATFSDGIAVQRVLGALLASMTSGAWTDVR